MRVIEQLEQTRDETLRYFSLEGEDLDKSYGPGKWTIRFILHHLSDAETVLYDRIRRVLSEPRPVIWAFDQDAWTRGLDYAHRPLEVSRGIYAAVREGILHEARERYETEGHREFVHSETGVRSVREEIDKVAWHNERHLEQIRRALSATTEVNV
jgi:hypothetical protein